MDEKQAPVTSSCSFTGIKPILVDLPYPPVQVSGRNQAYANLLSIDYCGQVSELSAITQYINNENRLFCARCQAAKTLLGIAMGEMMHLQKLGELIHLLGGNVDYVAKQRNGQQKLWTPAYLNIPGNERQMLLADIEAERAAVNQYAAHSKMINDKCINAVLARIILDEEYHIMILKELVKEAAGS